MLGMITGPAFAATSVQAVFVPATLGATVADLDKTLGPAAHTAKGQRTYTVAGCPVTFALERGRVETMEMDVNAACNPNMQAFVAHATPVMAYPQTFGSLQAVTGEANYEADCLVECGNAADPNLFMIVRGSRANGFIDVQFTSIQVDGATLDAAMVWTQALAQHHDQDYLIETRFNCDESKDAQASRLLAPAKVTHVKVGDTLDPTGCAAN
jgi:hypothetical protein